MHPILASLEAAGPHTLSTFFHDLCVQLAQFGKQAIDTPAERLAIVSAVTVYFDKYLAGTLPEIMRQSFRDSLVGIVDSTLTALASL